MSGGEKFKVGYNLTSAGMDIATSGIGVVGIISSVPGRHLHCEDDSRRGSFTQC